MCLKTAESVSNSVDPDQYAIWVYTVWSGLSVRLLRSIVFELLAHALWIQQTIVSNFSSIQGEDAFQQSQNWASNLRLFVVCGLVINIPVIKMYISFGITEPF